jgi:hypothetical protein
MPRSRARFDCAPGARVSKIIYSNYPSQTDGYTNMDAVTLDELASLLGTEDQRLRVFLINRTDSVTYNEIDGCLSDSRRGKEALLT